jgi:hypothetical protein
VSDGTGFLDVERNLSEVALALFAPATVAVMLQRIVDLAALAVEGCDAAGMFVTEDGAVVTVAASRDVVRVLDGIQIETSEGPCLEAAATGVAVYAPDLLEERRWPAFAPAAVREGVRSVLALALPGPRPSALNLYAELPNAFAPTDRGQGQLFATLAQLALDAAQTAAVGSDQVHNLHQALESREMIGRAQGILMEREKITAEQAFDVLRRASQRMNVTLREVATALVETGESPPVP